MIMRGIIEFADIEVLLARVVSLSGTTAGCLSLHWLDGETKWSLLHGAQVGASLKPVWGPVAGGTTRVSCSSLGRDRSSRWR